ncbi:MAG: response regulator [Deltaproteobacteria bacterium]|nr:MAG: response regulator [Deltaproteobacteria bacterium]
MTESVLIVDDEPDLLEMVEFNLEKAGFRVLTAANGADAMELARAELPSLILLDLMLPDVQGTEVCRTLKSDARTRDIPIIMVTARGEEIDRVVGFELGAEDYVVKPFSPRELVLRVKAMLKRMARPSVEEPAKDAVLHFGDIKVDQGRHRVWVGEEEVQLTALEFRLLSTFIRRRGRVQSRERLLDDVWGIDVEVTTRTVDTHVKRLREKLLGAGQYIETVRGVGYRFSERPEDAG